MSHYAKVLNGKVVDVIVAEEEFFDTFIDSSPGKWIQTSYNTQAGVHLKGGTPLRKNYAGVGFTYDEVNDIFIRPKPYDSWILNDNFEWEAPIEDPNTANEEYIWDEENSNWKLINTAD